MNMTQAIGAQHDQRQLDAGAARVREIRRQLHMQMHGGWRDSSSITPNTLGTIIRSAMTEADILGLSGEDRYALLAHYALEAAEKAQRAYLEHLNLCNRPLIALRGAAWHP